MKHFFTLISVFILSFSLSAQPDDARRSSSKQGRITISTLSNNPVRVIIDGRNYAANGNNNSVTINDVRAGYHTIKIYQQRSNRSSRRFSRNMELIYDARIQVRSKVHTDIIINRFGRAFVDERQMNADYYSDHDDDQYLDEYATDVQPMNNFNFNQFRESLRQESFDNTRLTLAQQTIDANHFSAAQVKELVRLFSFEENKLALAKYAFRNTVDRQNYSVVNEEFSYSSSKEQLAQYIREFK